MTENERSKALMPYFESPLSIDPHVQALTRTQLLEEIGEFRALLDAKVREQEIHDFLAAHSYFFNGILRLYGHSPLYSKVKLGADYEVDFAWFDTGSYGAEWCLVEIESPAQQMFTKAGEPSAALNHALQQVRDWNAWIHRNLHYARESMPHIEYPQCYIFIGRRAELTPDSQKRLKRLRYEHRSTTEIHTLDWIAGNARSVENLLGSWRWNIPSKSLTQAELRSGKPEYAFEWLNLDVAKGNPERRLEERENAHEYNESLRDL